MVKMHVLQSLKRQKSCHNVRNQKCMGGRVHPVKKSMWTRPGRRPPPSVPDHTPAYGSTLDNTLSNSVCAVSVEFCCIHVCLSSNCMFGFDIRTAFDRLYHLAVRN